MKKLYKLFLQRQHFLKRHLDEEGVKYRLAEIDLAIVVIQQELLKSLSEEKKKLKEVE